MFNKYLLSACHIAGKTMEIKTQRICLNRESLSFLRHWQGLPSQMSISRWILGRKRWSSSLCVLQQDTALISALSTDFWTPSSVAWGQGTVTKGNNSSHLSTRRGNSSGWICYEHSVLLSCLCHPKHHSKPLVGLYKERNGGSLETREGQCSIQTSHFLRAEGIFFSLAGFH